MIQGEAKLSKQSHGSIESRLNFSVQWSLT